MKFEASHNDQIYVVELNGEDSDRGPCYQANIQGAHLEKSLAVRLLSHDGERWTLEVEGRIEDVVVTESAEGWLVEWRNRTFPIRIRGHRAKLILDSVRAETEGVESIEAQMAGTVVTVLVDEGQQVETGQGLVIIEAMKMQNELRSPKTGIILTCNVGQGTSVKAGDLLFEIE